MNLRRRWFRAQDTSWRGLTQTMRRSRQNYLDHTHLAILCIYSHAKETNFNLKCGKEKNQILKSHLFTFIRNNYLSCLYLCQEKKDKKKHWTRTVINQNHKNRPPPSHAVHKTPPTAYVTMSLPSTVWYWTLRHVTTLLFKSQALKQNWSLNFSFQFIILLSLLQFLIVLSLSICKCCGLIFNWRSVFLHHPILLKFVLFDDWLNICK